MSGAFPLFPPLCPHGMYTTTVSCYRYNEQFCNLLQIRLRKKNCVYPALERHVTDSGGTISHIFNPELYGSRSATNFGRFIQAASDHITYREYGHCGEERRYCGPLPLADRPRCSPSSSHGRFGAAHLCKCRREVH
jgi:hypothetical protein